MTLPSNNVSSLCPNCTQHPADTVVDYDEIVDFSFSTHYASRRRRVQNAQDLGEWQSTLVRAMRSPLQYVSYASAVRP